MIVLDIRTIAEKRGLTTAYQLQKQIDVAPTVAARLWRGETIRLSMDIINRLCDGLECGPGDLFTRENGKKAKR